MDIEKLKKIAGLCISILEFKEKHEVKVLELLKSLCISILEFKEILKVEE